MNKTRFQLPPRAGSEIGVDHRRSVTKLAFASGEPADMPASIKFPFLFDLTSLLALQRRNIEAIAAANKVVREGARAAAQRNLAFIQHAIDDFSDRVQTMGNPECPRDRAIRQTETAIKAYEDAAANVQALGEIIQDANIEAMQVLNRRFTEAADEGKSLARYATRRFWDTETKPAPFWETT